MIKPENMALTAYALRTPLGNTLDEVYQNGLDGRSEAALVGSPKPSKQSRFLKRMGLFALETAHEVFQKVDLNQYDRHRVGIFFGYGGLRADWNEMRSALIRQNANTEACWDQGLSTLHPFWILKHLSNNAHALVAEEHKIKGEGVTFGGLNSGVQALVSAQLALQEGAIEAALVLTHDSLLEPEILLALNHQAGVQGYVPAEGTAAFFLEKPSASRHPSLAFLSAFDFSDGESFLPRPETLKRSLSHIQKFHSHYDFVESAHCSLEWNQYEKSLVQELFSVTHMASSLQYTGQMGSTSALVQTLLSIKNLKKNKLKSALNLSAGFPGLLGAVHVEVL